MNKRKTLKELTLKDNFMFGAVMCDEDNCRRLLEMILQFPIERVVVSKEKCIVYHPEYKGIRMDVYAKDENNTLYNVEMQAIREAAIGKRARYYHSQIDMDLLLSGADYSELPNTYVIFICDFDPFGEGKYCYTFEQRCLESQSANLQDGSKSIFLSTQGKNPNDVSKSMVNFLNYVKADLSESTSNFEDDFVESLQKSVQHIKESRRMEERFMGLYEMLRDEHAEGKAEGIAYSIVEFLKELGPVSEELEAKILEQTNLDVLSLWLKLAVKSDSIEKFMQQM